MRASASRPWKTKRRAPAFFGWIGLAAVLGLQFPAEAAWYKGNTHAHTTESDGDASPSAVAAWYHDRGYHFLTLSDHNRRVDPAQVPLPPNRRSDFILIPGEEITSRMHVHSTSLNIADPVDWRSAGGKTEIIQSHVDGTLAAQGVPILNHPNFRWALTAADILPVRRLHLFELYNGHPGVNNSGGRGRPSTEALWDELLTAGMPLYAVASDDAHHYRRWGRDRINPGRGWIMVKAGRLSSDAIVQAMLRGDFYASSGVILEEIRREGGVYTVIVDEAETEAEITSPFLTPRKSLGEGYLIEFIGLGGAVLDRVAGTRASFPLGAAPAYVRCRVTLKRGQDAYYAWAQPVF